MEKQFYLHTGTGILMMLYTGTNRHRTVILTDLIDTNIYHGCYCRYCTGTYPLRVKTRIQRAQNEWILGTVRHLENPSLLEAPEGEGLGQGGVAGLGGGLARHLHLSREELVGEEVQGAGEDHTGVVPSLKYKLKLYSRTERYRTYPT